MLIPLGILNAQGAAAGGVLAYDLLETQVLSTSAASVTFTGLGSYSDYKHLQIRVTARNDRTATGSSDNLKITLNGDTGSNYSYGLLRGDGSAVNSFHYASQTGMLIAASARGFLASDIFSGVVIDLLDFSSGNKNSTLRALAGQVGDGTFGSGSAVWLSNGAWFDTSQITSMNILEASGNNFVAGSRFSLYGIKG